jgi:hypothetical protein
VLLSCRLILVQFPYFNEPGYECSMGTPAGMAAARVAANGGYERLRVATVRWAMIDTMRHPPHGFEAAVTAHFRLKRSHICGVVGAWLSEAGATAGYVAELVAAARDLLATFASVYGSVDTPEERALAAAIL